MRSGLDAPESESAFSPVAQMEYTHADMAGFAALHRPKHEPGPEWECTSADTPILDRLLGRIVGGGATGMRAFAERELFAPLHMTGVTMVFNGPASSLARASSTRRPALMPRSANCIRMMGSPLAPYPARGVGRMVAPLHAGSAVWLRLLDH